DIPQQGGTNAGETDQPVFEPIASATDHVAWLDFLDEGQLAPNDTNGKVDLYQGSVANPGTPARLLTAALANRSVTAGTSAQGGSVTAYTTAASDLPGGDLVHDQAYLRSAAGDANITGQRAPEAGDANLGDPSLGGDHAVSDNGGRVAFASDAPAFGAG